MSQSKTRGWALQLRQTPSQALNENGRKLLPTRAGRSMTQVEEITVDVGGHIFPQP